MITLCPEGYNPITIETESIRRGGGKPRLEPFTSLSRKNFHIHDGNEPKTFNMNAITDSMEVTNKLFEWYTDALLCELSIEDVEGEPENYSVAIEDFSYEDDGEFFNYSISLIETDGIIEVSQ